MGWFSKKISDAEILGSDAGQLARTSVLGEFALTEYHSGGKFTQPSGFFRDPYIVGFLHGYLVTMADVGSATRKKRWTQEEASEFMISAMEAAVGSENVYDFISETRKCKDSVKYKDAYFSANTLIKAIFANGALANDNSLVCEAKILVEERKMFLAEIIPNAGKIDFLSWAIQEISINRHIRLSYLEN